MAQIIVRGLDPEVKEQLRRRAAGHGRSMEAEARHILTAAAGPVRKSVVAELREVAARHGGVDLVIPPRGETQRAVEFDP